MFLNSFVLYGGLFKGENFVMQNIDQSNYITQNKLHYSSNFFICYSLMLL